MADPDIQWEGDSGSTYEYWIYEIGASFKDKPGNYIYAMETETNRWRPIYIGQTERLADRLAGHEKKKCALENGATHVHAHVNIGGEEARRAEETDLIHRWNSVCND